VKQLRDVARTALSDAVKWEPVASLVDPPRIPVAPLSPERARDLLVAFKAIGSRRSTASLSRSACARVGRSGSGGHTSSLRPERSRLSVR
jgi:hypothetical protein